MVWQGCSTDCLCGRRSHSDIGPLHGIHNVQIQIYKYTHSLPFMYPARRERWELFLRVRRDHTSLMLWHSVFAYHVTSALFSKSTLWPFEKPSVIMKWNTVITFTRGLFQSRCSTHCQNAAFMTHSQWAAPHRAVTQLRLVTGLRVGLWFQKLQSLQTLWVQHSGWEGKAKAWVLLYSGLTLCRQQNIPQARQTIIKDYFKARSELCYPQNGQQCAQGQGRIL